MPSIYHILQRVFKVHKQGQLSVMSISMTTYVVASNYTPMAH